MMKLVVASLAVALAACVVPKAQVQSTATLLGPQRSTVVVGMAARPATLEVVRLFASRGFAVTSQKVADDGSLLLRVAGSRRTATTIDQTSLALHTIANLADDDYDYDEQRRIRHELEEEVLLGSAFYVHVKPLAPDQSTVAIIGRPMHEGVEACTPDLPATGCAALDYDDAPHAEISGAAEAEIVNGVFAELRVGGVVLSPDPAIAEAKIAADTKCQERRVYLQDLASKITDPKARAGVLRTMPSCTKGTLVALPSK